MTSILVWIYLVGMTMKSGMKAGRESMSYESSGELKHNQRTRVAGAMHEETFLMTIGKGARQTRDIQTMGLVHT